MVCWCTSVIPQAHEDDAERAVRAGLDVIAAVSGLKPTSPLQTRVGIATGLVVVGDLIGSGGAQEQAIVGETPNLAARLQGIAEPNTIVIAESTRKLLGNLFELQDLGAKEVKGIAEPVRAWAALRASSVESRFEALRAATTPLVGRDEELALLMQHWEQAKAGDGQVVLISGEPGIGKSRIARDDCRTAYRRAPHPLALFLLAALSGQCALSDHWPARTCRRVSSARIRPNNGSRSLRRCCQRETNDLSEAAPLIADLLSIPTGDRYPPLDLTPQKHKEKTLHALLAQLEGLCGASARADGVGGPALERPHHTRVPRPSDRSGAQASGADDHDFPAGVHATLDRTPPCDDAHA